MAFFKKQPKTCNKCGKPLTGKYRECKDCRKLYDTQRYSEQKQQIISRNVQRKREIVAWYREQKSKPCMVCGGLFHFACMDFDHLDGYTKKFDISWAVRNGISKDRIVEELRKTQLLCSNCHRYRTFLRLKGEKFYG
jgi:hypothetical protein